MDRICVAEHVYVLMKSQRSYEKIYQPVVPFCFLVGSEFLGVFSPPIDPSNLCLLCME